MTRARQVTETQAGEGAQTAAAGKPVYLSTLLRRMGACDASIAWVRRRRGKPGGLRATWEACPNGDWLFFVAQGLYLDNHILPAEYAAARDAFWSSPQADAAGAVRAAMPFDVMLAGLERAAVAS